jgi:hypothetical protein
VVRADESGAKAFFRFVQRIGQSAAEMKNALVGDPCLAPTGRQQTKCKFDANMQDPDNEACEAEKLPDRGKLGLSFGNSRITRIRKKTASRIRGYS